MELKATETVIEQAKLMANNFSEAKVYSLNNDEMDMAAE
jgi:hypothetical protein